MGLIPKRGQHYRKPALWKRILKWTALSLLVIVLSVGIAAFIFVYHTLGKIGLDTEVIYEAKQQLDIAIPDQPENILIMGTDSDPDGTNQRSDTIMLARVNPEGECLSILSMPRDLIVNIPGVGQDKINSAYAVGGAPLAIETVKELTEQPVHHFVMIDYTGFEQAVDAMGGVYIDVDKRYFNDNSDALWGQEYEPIDIYPGYQKLSGKDALAFVRYRHTDSDFMRIARQQLFINDTKAQSMEWGNLTKIPELADVFASNTTSDIGRSDVLSLTKFIMGLSRDRIFQVQAPVDETSESYLSLAEAAFSQAIDDFNSPAFAKPDPQIPGAAAPGIPSEATRNTVIEILNGNGVEGAAGMAADLLKLKGFTSVAIGGNASNSYGNNQIYFREGNEEAAGELATLLKPATVSPIPPELNTKAQVLVAVGSNFEGELTEKQPEVNSALNYEQNSETGRRSWQSASLQLPFQVQKPSSFPAEFDYMDFHIYEIQTDDGPRPALKVVGESEAGDTWGIMETTYTNAPLLDNPTLEREISGKNYRFFYVADKLKYLAWQDGDVVYWISNSLQNTLSEDTMVQLATSFGPV